MLKDDVTLEGALENHLAAIGGKRVVEAVRSIRVEFRVVEPEFTVDGVYTAERPDRMRVDIHLEGVRVFTEGCAGGQGWQMPRDAAAGVPSSPAGARALVRGIENNLYGLHELPRRGHSLQLDRPETLDGVEYVVIRQGYPGGGEIRKFLNPATWRIERSRERKALHPDVDPTETTIETHFDDFRWVDGLLRPFHEVQTDLQSGRVLQTTFIKQIEINPEFAPGRFDRP